MSFGWFKRTTAEDYKQAAKEIYNLPELKTSPNNELYRVGVTGDGRTTLTMMSTDGFSMTMSMTPAACEQMIRMIRSTYETDIEDENETA